MHQLLLFISLEWIITRTPSTIPEPIVQFILKATNRAENMCVHPVPGNEFRSAAGWTKLGLEQRSKRHNHHSQWETFKTVVIGEIPSHKIGEVTEKK